MRLHELIDQEKAKDHQDIAEKISRAIVALDRDLAKIPVSRYDIELNDNSIGFVFYHSDIKNNVDLIEDHLEPFVKVVETKLNRDKLYFEAWAMMKKPLSDAEIAEVYTLTRELLDMVESKGQIYK